MARSESQETDVAKIHLTIDGCDVAAEAGASILEAARAAGVYIPALCAHPDLAGAERLRGEPFVYRGAERIETDEPDGTWDGCGLCAVGVDGGADLRRACTTPVADGMVVDASSAAVVVHRQAKLGELLADHPHACLTCAQQDGCSRTQCSSNVPEDERCCELLGSCELQRLARFIGLPASLAPYRPRGLPAIAGEPLFEWRPELCVACLRCVRACRDLRGVGTLGFVFRNARPVVGTTAGCTRAESHCRFCGACVEVCPTGALTDKIRAVGDRRRQLLVPCRSSCPAGIDIPRFVRRIARRQYDQAIAVVREKLPFSFAPSYVCFHPCEQQCRRGEVNQPVAVCQLKRFVADHDTGWWRARQKRLPPTGRRVAVVGSGPAGLTAAYYLAKQGHAVVIFESLAEPGGMLRVGIPEFRYPRALLQRDIDEVRGVGVEIRVGAAVTGEAELQKLADGHDAVLLATGAHRPKRIEVPGVELKGVLWGIHFLRDAALGQYDLQPFRDRSLIVIGGGNVAVDAARVARRLGAGDVRVVSLEPRNQLPAYAWEVQDACEEGIDFVHGWGLRQIVGSGDVPVGVELKRCLRVFDPQGRFQPVYDDQQIRREPADAVILAIGQEPSAHGFGACGLAPEGTIAVDAATLRTGLDSVFAAGDVVSGPASVIDAIAMGRRAAAEIDKALGGDGDIDEQLADPEPVDHHLGRREQFAGLPRAVPARRASAESFELIEQSFGAEQATAEASRCLACDLRVALQAAPLAPRTETLLDLQPEVVDGLPSGEGVYQLLDEERNVLAIKGVMNIKEALCGVLEEDGRARWFVYELEPMYTQRESELIQQYLQQHGKMPGGGEDELDDLF